MFRTKYLVISPALFFFLAIPGAIAGLDAPLRYIAAANILAFIYFYLLTLRNHTRNFPITPQMIIAATFVIIYIFILFYSKLPTTLYETWLNTWLFAALSASFCVAVILIISINFGKSIDIIADSVFGAVFTLCVIQLLLFSFGVESGYISHSPQARLNISTLENFKIYIKRADFPMASGFQYSAMYPSILAAYSLGKLRSGSIYIISFIISIFMLILIDARGFLIAPFMAFLTVQATSRLRARFAAAMGLAIPAIPVIVAEMGNTFSPLVNLLFPERDSSSFMFSNRELIWDRYFSTLGRMDFHNILLGFGGYGQYTSGINRRFSEFFDSFSYEGRVLAHMHNSYMQVLVDMGVAGLCFLLVVIFMVIRRATDEARARNNGSATSVLIMIYTMQWAAGSEIILTPYAREGFLMILLLWLAVAADHNVSRKEPAQKRGRVESVGRPSRIVRQSHHNERKSGQAG